MLGEKQAPHRPRHGAAHGHSAGRAAGLRQDHHRGQAGAAAQAGAEGAVPGRGRRLSSRRHRSAADAGQADRCRGPRRHRHRRTSSRSCATASVAAGKARARTVMVDTAGRLQIDDEMMGELQAAQGRGLAARDPARRRRHDGAGRGPDRPGLPRRARHHRRDPDQDGRRCPGRRGALDLRRHPRADQVHRRGREARCAGAVPSRPAGRPDPAAGRHPVPGGEGAGRGRREGSRAAGARRSPRRRASTSRTSSAPCGRCRRWGRSRTCSACCRG